MWPNDPLNPEFLRHRTRPNLGETSEKYVLGLTKYIMDIHDSWYLLFMNIKVNTLMF